MKTIERIAGETDQEYECRKAAAREAYLKKRRAYYAAHAEECREKCKKYRLEHLDEIKAREKRFYLEVVKKRKFKCNLKQRDGETDEEFAQRIEAYKEKCRASHRRYCKENADKIKKTAKLYYEKNKARISELHKKYLHEHRVEQKSKSDARLAAIRLARPVKPKKPPMTPDERRKRALERYYANREQISIQRKARYLKNRDRELAHEKRYRELHKDKFEQYRAISREKSRKKVVSWFSSKFGERIDKDRVYGVIYLFSNVCTDRFYVGQTVCLKKRYWSGVNSFVESAKARSDSVVLQDLETFGIESFSGPDLLAVAYSKEELDFLEAHYIKVYDSFKTGYNKTSGNIKSLSRKAEKEQNA